MTERRVDVAILGAGTAGLTARRAAEKAGATALLIDPGPLGTTCAREGCMPSKLLIAAAETAHHVRHAEVFGLNTTLEVDGARVLQRVQRERDRFVGFVLDASEELEAGGKLLRGRGQFVAPGQLRVETADGPVTVHARSVVIATGSSPFVPPPFRGLGDVLLSNAEVFELEALPKSVLVAGTGVIGLELGQALHRLGVRVTLVGLGGRVGPLSDPKMIAAARSVFSDEFPLRPDYQLESVERVEGGAEVVYTSSDGERHRETYERILIAAGRVPNVRNLGLAEAGIEVDRRGMPRFNTYSMQVGEHPVFLAGDVNNDRPLLHEAADEGRIAGENAARYPDVQCRPRRTSLGIVFTDPQIAVVGQSWTTMDCTGYRVGEVSYGNQGRARVMNQHRGRVRIYGEVGTGLLLGAEMLGPRVEHTAHLLAWAIQQRMTVAQALTMPFYHPVIEEGIRTALQDLNAQLKQGRPPGVPCEEFGPGT